MAMLGCNVLFVFFLVSCLVSLGESSSDEYARNACSVTEYPDVCVQSLSPFSNKAKKSHSRWARVGVSVTLRETKSVATYLARLKDSKSMKGRYNNIALSDCIELFREAIDELHRSLRTLRRLSANDFDAQMSDVSTWLSATLTDQDTCLDGFEERTGKQVKSIRSRVTRLTYYSSNALALVNKLASTGLDAISNP